jgi:Xaa-Pro aminopeptidase
MNGERLLALRSELGRRQIDGVIVPRADEHLSENVAPYAERLAWLTGFRGSRGIAVVLAAEAAIFVPGIYAAQVRRQVDTHSWTCHTSSQESVAEWLARHVVPTARIGYDPWLHTTGWLDKLREALAAHEASLVPLDSNPVDAVWPDRPSAPMAKLLVHPLNVAGISSAEKRASIARFLQARRADAAVIAALDSVAWLLNIRGQDVPHTPVAYAFAVIRADASAELFVHGEKLSQEIVDHLGESVRLHERTAFSRHLATLAGKRVVVDPERTVAAVSELLRAAGATVIWERDPVVLPKATKNATEIAGHRQAQLRDGVALTRFLHWFSTEAPTGRLTEISAADRLYEFRRESGALRDLVSETISAFGPNASLPHYRPTVETNLQITSGALYMVDSGGQYIDGTTDVTRTVSVGPPRAEWCDRFTRVLKGHIAIAQATFPLGTRGSQLDVLARQFLWQIGLDFPHSTGHGVGSYLCVHEGPQRIFNKSAAPHLEDEMLMPGMILSNEPAYYKAEEYGIRTENCILVVSREAVAGNSQPALGFETLTLAPLDRALIDLRLITPAERAWIDSYHADVARLLGPYLAPAVRTWLLEVTRPLDEWAGAAR